MDDRNKLIEKLGELSAKAYMFGRMYHIDEVAELTKDINELIAKVFDYSPWYTGTPTEEGDYIVLIDGKHFLWEVDDLETWNFEPVTAWQKIEPYKEKEK